MDPNESAPVSELDAMSKQLAQMEAAQAADQHAPKPDDAPAPDPSATPAGDRAPAPDKTGTSTPKTDSTDTPSEADKAAIETAKAEAAKEGKELKLDAKGNPERDPKSGQFVKQDKKPAADAPPTGSKFAQDFERRDKSWKAINAEKETLAAEKSMHEATVKAERAKLDAERQTFQQEVQTARQAEAPEAFDKYAASEARRAADLEVKAKAAEAAGDFDKADELRKAALLAKGFEDLAKDKANDLRRNPPPTDEAKAKKNHEAMKEWTLKAATDFPEFGKKESAIQVEAVKFLQYMKQNFPSLAATPQLVYFAAERAQYKAAADRVPGMEKELGDLKTKVTELEALTNPTPAGGAATLPSAKSFEQMTAADQYAQLKAEAAGI